jgi:enamine deaminase RidA (YjgF/YER057c/UK114 family)
LATAINQSLALTFPAMSQGVRAGNLLFLAGQVALDEQGNLIGEGDPRRQAQQIFANIEALAGLAGGSIRDVVRLTCYLSDRRVYPAYAEVKASVFSPDVRTPPAGTAVVVTELLDSRFLLEVEATLVLSTNSAEVPA